MAYDAAKDLEYIDQQLAYFLYIVGLTPEQFDGLTIDAFLEKARETAIVPGEGEINVLPFGSLGIEMYKEDPEFSYILGQRINLISNIRRFWYLRQLALGASNRG